MYTDGGDAEAPGQAAAESRANEQRAHQARSGGVGDPVEVMQAFSALVQRRPGQGHDLADVVAGGQFRHDAAEVGVQVDLAVQDIGEQPGLRVVERDSGFVAGRLDSQYQHVSFRPNVLGQLALCVPVNPAFCARALFQ